MSNKDNELAKELHLKFAEMKNQLGFKSSFEEIDDIFFISDAVLHSGFVSENALSRQIASRISDTFMGWNNYLHNLFMPQPYSMIAMQESKMVSEENRKHALKLIGEAMSLVNTNMMNGLTKDKLSEAYFIDESVNFWNNKYRPILLKIVGAISEGWKK